MNQLPVYAVRQSPTIFSEHFDDEVVVANLVLGMYYSLRFTAMDLWKLLENGATTDQLKKTLQAKYLSESVDMDAAVTEFLDQLLTQELVVETTHAAPDLSFPSFETKLPFVKPELVVYDDMQDLLALDPIHDVDDREGWPTKKQ